VSIGDLFEIVCRVVGVSASVIQDSDRVRPDTSEVMVLQSEPRKAKERLNWCAGVSLEEGVERTVRWLEQNISMYTPDRYHV
jgi:UDP-glucose 4-epimerase